MTENYSRNADSLLIEKGGIEYINENRRHGHPSNQFTIRFSPVIYLAPIFIGGIAIPDGLGLAGSISAILFANVLGSVVTGICAAMGPRRGMTQMVMSRLSFGYLGNYLPSICASMVTLGFTTVGTIVGVKALVNLTGLPFVPLALGLVILSLIFTVFGHNLLHSFGRWMTVLGFVLLFVTTVFVLLHGTGAASIPTLSGHKYWLEWLNEFTIVFSYTVSWNIYASDYSRYLPSSSSFKSVFGYAFAGLFMATSWMMILGALLASVKSNGVLGGLDAVLPSLLLIIVLTALTITSLAHNAVNLYSFSMQTIAWDFPLKRVPLAILAGAIVCVASILLGRTGFVGNLTNFLLVLSYFVVPWFSVILIDFLFESRSRHLDADAFYRKDGPLKGVRWPGLLAFLAGIAVSTPFMANGFFTGPLARSLGGADISYFVSFVAAFIIYALAKILSSSPYTQEIQAVKID